MNNLSLVAVNVCPLITLCALDIICETSMGVQLNTQTCETHPYEEAISEFTELAVRRTFHPHQWNDTIYFNLLPAGRRAKRALDVLLAFTRGVMCANNII